MSALLYPMQVQKTFSYLSVIRCEIEKHFNVNIRSGERNISTAQRTGRYVPVLKMGGYQLKADGLKFIRGEARKYFCYLVKIYLDLPGLDIAKYIDVDITTVNKHISGLHFRSSEEENVLAILSDEINKKIVSLYRLT